LAGDLAPSYGKINDLQTTEKKFGLNAEILHSMKADVNCIESNQTLDF